MISWLSIIKNKFDPWAWKENNDLFPPFIENYIMKSLNRQSKVWQLIFRIMAPKASCLEESAGPGVEYSLTYYLFKPPFIHFIYFIYLRLCRVFVAACRLSLAEMSRGFSLQWLSLSQGTQALGRRASAVLVHSLSFPVVCGIFLDWGLNPCPLHWQVDLTTRPPGKQAYI